MDNRGVEWNRGVSSVRFRERWLQADFDSAEEG